MKKIFQKLFNVYTLHLNEFFQDAKYVYDIKFNNFKRNTTYKNHSYDDAVRRLENALIIKWKFKCVTAIDRNLLADLIDAFHCELREYEKEFLEQSHNKMTRDN